MRGVVIFLLVILLAAVVRGGKRSLPTPGLVRGEHSNSKSGKNVI